MTRRMARWWLVAGAVALVLVTPRAVYSCGPFFDEAIFIPSGAPQVSQEDFAAGKLGIVLPGLRRSYLIVAYRYLSGMKLNAEQRHDAIDVWNRNMGPAPPPIVNEQAASRIWEKAREEMAGAAELKLVSIYAPVAKGEPYQLFLNCPEDAFRAATGALKARVERYGAGSAAVKDWLAAQDQVFANCDGRAQVVPAVLDSTDPLLRADRNYQIAAAKFYGRDFDGAAAAFEEVAKDAASPWAPYGEYLAARAMVRKAMLSTADYGKFDIAGLRTAQTKLEETVRDSRPGAAHAAAERLLDYVRFHTEPEKRVAKLEQVVLKPDPGAEFKQHLWDYVLLVSNGEQAEDLSDWVKTFYRDRTYEQPLGLERSYAPAEAEHAIAKWREQRSLPWLIAALAVTGPNDASAAELLKAADQVPTASPGYLSVRYYALRMMAQGKQQDVARQELDGLLRQADAAPAGGVPGTPAALALSHGTRNLFNDERQRLSTSLADFLGHAAETPSQIGYEYGSEDEAGDEEQDRMEKEQRGAFFNDYVGETFALRLPISLLVESAKSSTLPGSLRRELARSTWMRAVVEGDLADADQLQPVIAELDKPLWKAMEGYRSAKTTEEKRFAAALLGLENPGLSPYVRTGLLRGTTLGEIDNFRDNWWCEVSVGMTRIRRDRDPKVAGPSFLSAEEREAAEKEMVKLGQAAVGANFLTAEVLAYTKIHPEDERAPRALHLAVRSTRYNACSDEETTHWSEKAFRLLHDRYQKSEWAEKTNYHY